ncbi:signal peptidase I [Wenzhouxiangella sp. XN79A]|uniref:signal peptidase I n=1 Tax=Wenzhouxiangella sp. XN79A TaxID=2724193 RepID=UPI00144A8392|nr:signal peptidase I [Wenzhouxiangella sp. XN79A]NKI34403.1 signal peptidase I [Wenzhouxiangella sp. XN79A]
MDFALIITLLTLASGVVWLLDKLWLRRRRQARVEAGQADSDAPSRPVEYATSFFPLLLLVLVFRSFLFEPFKIPSGSMLPTLLIGDFIVVSKYSYGLRLPVLNTKILETGEPERGDVFVFRYPDDPGINYIKRVIGLPGDTVTYRDKMLFVNGEAVEQTIVGPWIGEGVNRNRPGTRPQQRVEQLGEVDHEILIHPGRRAGRAQSWTVPEGHYFAMGDNRDASLDSRAWGFVPEQNLVGKAIRIWMHWDCGRGFCVDFSRIGDRIE